MTPEAPERGDHVRNGDVAPHAKPKCKTCRGKGLLVRITREPGSSPAEKRTEFPCGCAMRRFLKNRLKEVFLERGQLFWIKGMEPEGRKHE